jgi:hypothetical protein
MCVDGGRCYVQRYTLHQSKSKPLSSARQQPRKVFKLLLLLLLPSRSA